eukprot:TRINITY_DN38157_c0_g1_i2.p1 TRINITY_DN38157_c0_g1~~TRINITY_DN38157_c0_g1_i2.p1  ORF type:complete len:1982 (+),score=590.78 TRINITY_DN38157_c0_g1_i2:149-6094(+)
MASLLPQRIKDLLPADAERARGSAGAADGGAVASPQRKAAWTDGSGAEADDNVRPPERVQVVCRVRPSDDYSDSCVVLESGEGGDIINVAGMERRFNVNKAFGEKSRQQDVFDYVGKPSIAYLMKGFCAAVFAYGQTGSGKTFTMTGTPDNPGLIPRMIQTVFSRLVKGYDDFTVNCQYLEVYMEKVRDLFNPTKAKNPWDAPGPKLNVRFDGKRVNVENAKTLTFSNDAAFRQEAAAAAGVGGSSKSSADDAVVRSLSEKLLRDLESAGRHRAVRSHALNAESSRSHAVLVVEINARKASRNIASTLMLVDLAGSENIGKAGVEGMGLSEAKSINKSLFSLTRCIEALGNGQKVPFRESVLTKLLTPALDGGSCCTLIAALRGEHPQETRETLKFTEMAIKVQVKPKQTSSEALGEVQEQAKDLKGEIQALKQELEWLKRNGQAESASLAKMVKEKEDALKEKMQAFGALQQEIREQEQHLQAIQKQLDTSKRDVEQEKAGRLRAEAELGLLQSRLDEAERRRLLESQSQRAEAQVKQEQRKMELLQKSKVAREEGSFEEALRMFCELLRTLQEELEGGLSEESHHARKSLVEDLQALAGDFQEALQGWPEVLLRSSDLDFVLKEVLAHKERFEKLAEQPSAPASTGDVARFQIVLEEVWRLCRQAATLLLGGASRPALPGEEGATALAPMGNSAALGLRGSLVQVACLLFSSQRRWQRYSRIWVDHWQPRLVGHGKAEDDTDCATVLLVACELQALFDSFVGTLKTMSTSAFEGGGRLEVVRSMCLRVLEGIVDEKGTSMRQSVEQHLGCAASEWPVAALPVVDGKRDAITSAWHELADSVGREELLEHRADVTRKRTEEVLKDMQVHRICDAEGLARHLRAPPAGFAKDVVRFVQPDSPAFQELSMDGALCSEAWSNDYPSKDVKMEFFERALAALVQAGSRVGLACELDAARLGAAVLGQGATYLLVFMAQFCLAAEKAAWEHSLNDSHAVARALRIGRDVGSFCLWTSLLREQVTVWSAKQRQALDNRLAGSEQSVGALKETITGLQLEKDRHLEKERQWEAERAALLQEMHKAKGEQEQAAVSAAAAAEAKMMALQAEMESWKARGEELEVKNTALEEKLSGAAAASGNLRPGDLDAIRKQRLALARMLAMVRETKDSVAADEGGQEVQDLLQSLDELLKTQLDALTALTGDAAEKAKKMDLAGLAGFIRGKKAMKRLSEAKDFAEGNVQVDVSELDISQDADGLDPEGDEECERLRLVLLALADRQATVGHARLEEERALVAFMRATLRKARQRLSNAEAAAAAAALKSTDDGEGAAAEPQPLLARDRLLALASAIKEKVLPDEERFVTLPDWHPEFAQLKHHVETSVSATASITLSVQRIRKIVNGRLESRFLEGIADQVHVQDFPSLTRQVFHGTHTRLCELIAEEGFCLPTEVGKKSAEFGDAVYFTSYSTNAEGFCTGAPGRLRSLLVCDIAPGEVLGPAPGSAPADDVGHLPNATLQTLRSASADTVYVANAGEASKDGDIFAVYDPRVAMPRYIVDFEIYSLGSEDQDMESEELQHLRQEVTQLRREPNAMMIKEIRERFQQMASLLGQDEKLFRLQSVTRQQDAALWDRCLGRLAQSTAEGPGLQRGLEVVMTRLERVVNPRLARLFYERAVDLFYPEEPFRLMFHGGTATSCLRIAQSGFNLEDAAAAAEPGTEDELLYGSGAYFSTSAAKFAACSPGSHKLLLCEVAVGKPMLAQARRPTLNLEMMQRAGFDSLHAPRCSEDHYDEWVVYHPGQALPLFLLSYDVQPRAVAAQLLREVADLEGRRRALDEQMAAVLQELEDAKKDAEETRMRLDERLAQQLFEEEDILQKARREGLHQQERLDKEQASQMQQLEQARKEVEEMRRKLLALDPSQASTIGHLPPLMPNGLNSPGSSQGFVYQGQPTGAPVGGQGAQDPGAASGQGNARQSMFAARNVSLPSLRGRK